MILFGKIIVYIIMACAFIGCMAYVFKEGSELGKQFLEGIYSIGTIFIPVAGITASIPYLTLFINNVFVPVFKLCGADGAMAATTFIAVDMGGYQLADALAQTRESWIMAMYTGYMAGATIVYTIPVALKVLEKEECPYLALGMMSGFVCIPFGVLIASVLTALFNPVIRETVATNGEGTYQIALSYATIFRNIIPLVAMCLLLVIGLALKPDAMIKGFSIFGKVMDNALTVIMMLCIVEYFTGVFTKILGTWGFEPIIADENNVNRALESAGYIGIMLCGAFPMVWLIRHYFTKPLKKIGSKLGLSEDAIMGILAGSANALALLNMIKEMSPEDKVICLSFTVCGSFIIGDHLSFTANYQPSLIIPIMLGKFSAAIMSIWLAKKISVPKLKKIVACEIKA